MTDHLDRRVDPIFVGYLPTPPRDRAFLLRVVPLLFAIAAVVAAGLSADQRTPGDGRWDLENTLVLEGDLIPGPYPLLRVPDETAVGGIRCWLLVEEGKFGAAEGVASLAPDGPVSVVARGHLIERDGRHMLELAGADALSVVGEPTLPPAATTDLGAVSLRGEIVDGKCWLGVMKPGAGKTHKACATLCIDGGVPPLIVWLDDDEVRHRSLIVGPDGDTVVPRFREVVADPVVLTGRLERRDDLEILRLDAGPGAVIRAR
jgi:hypothetical protein